MCVPRSRTESGDLANTCACVFLATGKTLEEIDALFARSPEVRERLTQQINDRRNKTGPLGRRASRAYEDDTKMDVSTIEKV